MRPVRHQSQHIVNSIGRFLEATIRAGRARRDDLNRNRPALRRRVLYGCVIATLVQARIDMTSIAFAGCTPTMRRVLGVRETKKRFPSERNFDGFDGLHRQTPKIMW